MKGATTADTASKSCRVHVGTGKAELGDIKGGWVRCLHPQGTKTGGTKPKTGSHCEAVVVHIEDQILAHDGQANEANVCDWFGAARSVDKTQQGREEGEKILSGNPPNVLKMHKTQPCSTTHDAC